MDAGPEFAGEGQSRAYADMSSVEASVMLPTYNRADCLDRVLQSLEQQTASSSAYEVIVIDDGSSDDSVALLESRPDLYAKLIKLTQNRGKGGAVKEGLKAATGDYILFQDADLEYDPGDYKRLIHPIAEFDADVVMGSRMTAPPYTRVYYFWHKVGNRFITLLFNNNFRLILTLYGQLHGERRSLAAFRIHIQGAAMLLDDLLGNEQTQAGTS